MKYLGQNQILIILLAFSIQVCAQDWPRFPGPERNSTSPQKGILPTWPEKGPERYFVNFQNGNVTFRYPPSAVDAGQNFLTRHFTVKDGLPSASIRCIFKDSRGLLWIGNDAALCTYDGKKFQIVRTSDGKTINQIWSITEDREGTVWFGSQSEGIYHYNGLVFNNLTTSDGLSDNRIRVIHYSKTFDLVAACSFAGANIIKNDTIITSPDWMGTTKESYRLTGVADAGDYLYFTSLWNINPIRYYPNENKFVSINDAGQYYPNGALGIYISQKGDTLFSKYAKGLMLITKDGVRHEENIGQVFNVDEDREGNIWMASWSYKNRDLKEGVFRFDGKDFVNFKSEFGITDKEIWTVYCDNEQDLIWVGTLNEGLYMAMKNEFTAYNPDFFKLEKLNINDLFVDSDTLWIADNHEMIRLFPNNDFSILEKRQMTIEFQKYWKVSNRNVMAQIDSVQRSLRTLNLSRLVEFEKANPFEFQRVNKGPDNAIYFSNRAGLFMYGNKRIDYFGSEGAEGFFEWIGKDTLIIAGWGITLINPKFRDKSANISKSTPRPVALPLTGTVFITFDPEGNPANINKLIRHDNRIWYASSTNGLWMSEGMNLVNFNETDPSIENNLNDICIGHHGQIMFASNRGIVYIAGYDGHKFAIHHRIDEKNGLQGNTIDWLVADPRGFLWIGTNLGLNCLDMNQLAETGQCRFRFFDRENGYDAPGSRKAVMDRNGHLYIAGESNLIRVNTNRLFVGTGNAHKIIATSLQINQQNVAGNVIREINRGISPGNNLFKVKHTQRNWTFHFDIHNYINPAKDKFRYKLGGYDQDWSPWTDARQAHYTNLPPGGYEFLVESGNQSSLTEAVPLRIAFTIPRAFWEMWFFRVFVILAFLTGIILVTRGFVDRKRKKQLSKVQAERKILMLEMQALQAQMNPHFIYNCLNGMQYSILDNKTEELLDYLNDFSKVLRFSLENASMGFIPLEKEIEFLNSYLRLEQNRFPELFDYHILIKDDTINEFVSIPPMMIQPFAENSIKHGFGHLNKKGLLSIEFEKAASDTIRCTITDNGKGRQPGSPGNNAAARNDRYHSTTIAEMRLRLHNHSGDPDKYRITYTDLVENGLPGGLKVEILLPSGLAEH